MPSPKPKWVVYNELLEKGVPGTKIAKLFGVSPQVVYQARKRAKNPPGPRRPHPRKGTSSLPSALQQKLVLEYLAGASASSLATKYGRPYPVVRNALAANGVKLRTLKEAWELRRTQRAALDSTD